MTYATLQDLLERFGEAELIAASDRTASNQIDATRVDAALVDADAEIDGYLASRHRLPLAKPHPLLKLLAANVDVSVGQIAEDFVTALNANQRVVVTSETDEVAGEDASLVVVSRDRHSLANEIDLRIGFFDSDLRAAPMNSSVAGDRWSRWKVNSSRRSLAM
jgi:phage gp36-like protein